METVVVMWEALVASVATLVASVGTAVALVEITVVMSEALVASVATMVASAAATVAWVAATLASVATMATAVDHTPDSPLGSSTLTAPAPVGSVSAAYCKEGRPGRTRMGSNLAGSDIVICAVQWGRVCLV